MVLLCTDGLHNLVNPAHMRRLLQRLSPQETCERLVAMANARGGKDNISVVCVRFGTGDWSTGHERNGSSRRFRLIVAIIVGLTIVALIAQTLWRRWRSAPDKPSPPSSLSQGNSHRGKTERPQKSQHASSQQNTSNANKPVSAHKPKRSRHENKPTQ